MQETNSDAVIHKSRALVSSVYWLYLGHSDELSISVVEIVLRYAMQECSPIRPTDLLIGIIGNLHDVDLKALPDTVVNSSAVVGLDKFIPSFAVSDVSLF